MNGLRGWSAAWMLAGTLIFFFGASAPAQEWTRELLQETSFDFGTVARGAKVEHRFPLENVFVEDVHIVSATASCGCTSLEFPPRMVKTFEKAELIARVDTKAYLGQKDVTIKVVFDKPYAGEAQLQIHCYIRSDVVVQPGVVQFGAVPQGAARQQKVAVSYAGRPDWRILSVQSPDPNITATATEISRRDNLVRYDLTVDVAGTAPAGYIRQQLELVTNDTNPRAKLVPVPVEGVVQSPITVHPSLLYMGTVDPQGTAAGQLVVRGNAPFKITRVNSTDARFRSTLPGTIATLHRIPITFQGDQAVGKINGKVRIETDSGGAPLEVEVTVEVAPRSSSEIQAFKPGAKSGVEGGTKVIQTSGREL